MPNNPPALDPQLKFQQLFRQETLFRSLIQSRQAFGAKHRILSDGASTHLTYDELITHTYALGQKIKKMTDASEHVGLLLPNNPITLVCFFALQAYGRVPALLNFTLGSQSIINSCQATAIRTIYTSRRFIEQAKLETLVAALSQEPLQLVYLEDLAEQISWFDKLSAKLKSLSATYIYRFTEQRIKASHEAVILFTSGSEGTPKGVALSHLNFQANRAQTLAVLDLQTNDVLLNVLPLFHSFGLTAFLLALFTGIKTIVYPSPLHYQSIPSLIYQTKTTVFFATDTFLQGYAHYAKAHELTSLRLVFAGAEKLKASTQQLWRDKFQLEILEGYGTTETSPILCLNTPTATKPGTVGRLLPAIQYQLQAMEGINGGCLEVSGPNIMLGYYELPNPGFLKPACNAHNTGDIVAVDAEGFITILGRAKRFAKIAGEMISLQAIEQFVTNLWPAAQHAVLSTAHAKHGESLVLLTNHPQAQRESLLEFAQSQGLTEVMLPKQIIILESMPLLASGKLNYKELEKLLCS